MKVNTAVQILTGLVCTIEQKLLKGTNRMDVQRPRTGLQRYQRKPGMQDFEVFKHPFMISLREQASQKTVSFTSQIRF